MEPVLTVRYAGLHLRAKLVRILSDGRVLVFPDIIADGEAGAESAKNKGNKGNNIQRNKHNVVYITLKNRMQV